MRKDRTGAKRTHRNDPTPIETLDRIAAAVSRLVENAHECQLDYSCAGFEVAYAKVTLADIRRVVAVDMAESGDRFSSDYRHEETEMHSVCLRILGSTVMLNNLCDSLIAEGAVVEIAKLPRSTAKNKRRGVAAVTTLEVSHA